MLKLYYAPNTCALASHIALEDAGADYEAVRIDFAKEEQRKPDYLAINPKARVPALVTDRGILTETPAILAFVAQSFPKSHLAPLDDPFAFAQAAGLQQLSLRHRPRRARPQAARLPLGRRSGGARGDAEEGAADGGRVLRADRARHARRALGDGRDLYDLPTPISSRSRNWLEGDGVDTARLPKVLDHRPRMAERPAVKAVLAAEAA